jgi:hypothetical protein
MNLKEKDFTIYPKFKHNLWTNYEDNPEVTYLILSHGSFEVPTQEANNFLKIRAWCTGYNSIASIAEKSNIPEADTKLMINSLMEIDALHLQFKDIATSSKKEIRNTLLSAIELWSEQLADTDISVDIFLGKTSKNVVIGWLLETYHYVKSFPKTPITYKEILTIEGFSAGMLSGSINALRVLVAFSFSLIVVSLNITTSADLASVTVILLLALLGIYYLLINQNKEMEKQFT